MEGGGPLVEDPGAEAVEREPIEAEESVEGREVELPAGPPTEAFEAEGGAPGGALEARGCGFGGHADAATACRREGPDRNSPSTMGSLIKFHPSS